LSTSRSRSERELIEFIVLNNDFGAHIFSAFLSTMQVAMAFVTIMTTAWPLNLLGTQRSGEIKLST
jgi:hypothetical protein